ncbi:RNA/RNP complex-1-interacting phosphatase isoform X2 [Aricia agestis]|uniref:RNA/RNP complex-1-interacting phosphatase isoform X2 n=1 Tax=Aricia agestis TaxID=91739 RepID=UPI001C20B773|nr:RNA/RNP complex-1-interacting phosphatase isoform X2 [Aricia agestis]
MVINKILCKISKQDINYLPPLLRITLVYHKTNTTHKSYTTMPRALPDRWIPYKACGKVIEGTRIICFKVPLKTSIQTNNPEIKEIWDVKTLLQTLPNLGLVIDLTNTKRYYDPQLIKSAGVDHKKILMPGRMLPPENIVAEFMGAVDEFLQNDKDRVVGVHCTHGLNRTGYMVCRYMRDRLTIPAKEAIKRFELARGYKMERRVYIDDILQTRSSPENWREKEDSVTEKDRSPHYRRERTDSMTERENVGSQCDRKKERGSITEEDTSRSPHDRRNKKHSWRSSNGQRRTEENWRSNKDRETDNWRSNKDRESDNCRSSFNRQGRVKRDSRRSLFEREKRERKNSRRSSCDEIDYTFDY